MIPFDREVQDARLRCVAGVSGEDSREDSSSGRVCAAFAEDDHPSCCCKVYDHTKQPCEIDRARCECLPCRPSYFELCRLWAGICCELAWCCSACLDSSDDAISFPALNITFISSITPPFSNPFIRVPSKQRSPPTHAASCCAAWSHAFERFHNDRPTNVERPITIHCITTHAAALYIPI